MEKTKTKKKHKGNSSVHVNNVSHVKMRPKKISNWYAFRSYWNLLRQRPLIISLCSCVTVFALLKIGYLFIKFLNTWL